MMKANLTQPVLHLAFLLKAVQEHHNLKFPEQFDQTLLFVQLVLSKTIALLVVIAIETAGVNTGFNVVRVWPSHWPVLMQFFLMLLLADFFRYWLHRWAHGIPGLWVFHAVHHAPRVLYWWNVGRFHPVDKALQICLDFVPFILIGAKEPVLAVYFVFYATNGFLQHSNIRLRHGFLNYVFSTAELHRWHHARDSNLARCNFGNNLIVWDLLLGTRYLPKGLQVDALGIQDQSYPEGFLGLINAPFVRGTASRSRSSVIETPFNGSPREDAP